MKALLNNKRELWSSKALAAAKEEAPIRQESNQLENSRTNEEEVIAREVKSALKDLVSTKLATIVEGLLDIILGKLSNSAQNGIRSVFYNVMEQFMLELLRKDVIEEMLDAHLGKFLDTEQPPSGFQRSCEPPAHVWPILRVLLGISEIMQWMRTSTV